MAIKDDIKSTTLSFHNLHEHGALFVNLLRARCHAFIIRNQWALPESQGLEYDQYDNPSSRWIAVHRGDEILAGVRLTPTTTRCGMYSYMIRDAQLGLLDSIPSNLLEFKAPVNPAIWEASRIFVTAAVPMRLRTPVQTLLMQGLTQAASENGATQLLALGPAVWARWIGRLGYCAHPAGPIMQTDGWRMQVAMMHLNSTQQSVDELSKARAARDASDGRGIIRRARLRRYSHLAQPAE